MKIKQIKKIEKPEKVYNLHIENNHNYVANDLVVSNCHQAKGRILQELLCGPFANIPMRWGLTGTVPKEPHEAICLHISLGPTIHKLAAKELQDRGILSNCNIHIQQLLDTREFTTYAEENKWLTSDIERLQWFAKQVEKIALSGNTLILINRIETGEQLEKLIPNSVFISGITKLTERKEHYDAVAETNNKTIIATFGVAAVGIDIPRLFNVILFEAGKSDIRVIQSIGRGIRKASDKDHVDVWDIASTCKYSSRHLTKRKAIYKEANYPFKLSKINWMSNQDMVKKN